MPAVHLSLLVSAADAHRVCLLDGFVEESRTAIGQAINFTLHAPSGPAVPGLIPQIGALAIPFEGHAQIDSRNYLIAGDGNQTSVVEAWAATPVEMALPPLRCDGSVDLPRQRQWEWHTEFLEQVRAIKGRKNCGPISPLKQESLCGPPDLCPAFPDGGDFIRGGSEHRYCPRPQ